MTQRPLQTERLDLIPLSDEDLPDEVELDSDPEVTHYIWGRARTRAEVEESHLQRMDRGRQVDGLGFWAARLRDDPARPFVGWWILAPLHGPDQGDWRKTPGVAELGYRLHRRHWRQGFASEGSRELLRHGFQDLGLDRVIAQAMSDNAGSRAVMESVGLTYVRSWDGDDGREVEYALTREEWLSHSLG
ncbi:GNAT family N-acetyltransferase [Knoellia sp. S7-12]|uniref:GNAT family N-acetyltransferase n=1 Tax=Knoellia sp. S7-12 TaxID=3126698 RepID=UPI00336659BC